jgi:DNA recombination protein RmuC
MELACAAFGLMAGGALVWLLLRKRIAALDVENRVLIAQKAALEARCESLPAQFKALSCEALESNSAAFDRVLQPLKESLSRVDTKIFELEKARAAAYGGLTEQISNLLHSQTQLRIETANLAKALRTPHVRGRWGEIQLRRVVEMAGMVEYCDFLDQRTYETSEGRVRPDLIVRLPNGRAVVVDSKAPLAAYLDALEARDDAARAGFLRAHASQVRSHLSKLASKNYGELPAAPEFVVCFLPGETFFSAALEQDPSLLEYGAAQGVVLATPTTLIALLKAVAYGWKQEKLAANAEEIKQIGQELYTRIRKLADHFTKVGTNLQRTVGCYNEAAATLESRVLVQARRFKELGASNESEIEVVEPVATAIRELRAPELEPTADRPNG